MRKKLAIIGASTGQLPLCLKAKKLGLETFCFAWEKNAVCKSFVDHFYPVSILEKEKISEICKNAHVDGVVSNASDITSEIAAYVAEANGLNSTSYSHLIKLRDKHLVRNLCKNIEGLSTPHYYKYEGVDHNIYPCVVKPCVGAAKKGVTFVKNARGFKDALKYAETSDGNGIEVEEYINGNELSVESISFHGKHTVIQITDKDSSGPPHFVELGHHQPANLPSEIKNKILQVVPQILTAIGYTNGASHIEMKYNRNGLYLIEANLRGGGDEISNRLTAMSTGLDYLRCMIEVALDEFSLPVRISTPAFAGIYYLCKQTADILPVFLSAKNKTWCVEESILSIDLKESHSNYERNGYLIYKANHKIKL